MFFALLEGLRGWLMPYPFWLRKLGPRGEYLARRHYHRQGYHCLATNWHCGKGELDLVMANRDHLLFVEVKTRRQPPHTRIRTAVAAKQRHRLLKISRIFKSRWYDIDFRCHFALVYVQLPPKHRTLKRRSGCCSHINASNQPQQLDLRCRHHCLPWWHRLWIVPLDDNSIHH